MKFNESASIGSLVVPGRTDMTKPIVANEREESVVNQHN